MIHVGVREDTGIDRFGIERQLAVALIGDVAFALKHAAVQQQPLAVDGEQMHRAGDGAGRTPELNLHEWPPLSDM